jgi:hypothetical protein
VPNVFHAALGYCAQVMNRNTVALSRIRHLRVAGLGGEPALRGAAAAPDRSHLMVRAVCIESCFDTK